MTIEDLLVKSGAVMFGEFTLTSGKKSNYYINIKKATTNPYILVEITKAMAKFVLNEKIAGIELGSVPLAVALSIETGRPFVIVRKESKTHGTKEMVEGDLSSGDEVLVVEDVVTTGGSVVRAINILKENGADVKKVLAVVDREEGGRENIEKEGISFIPLLKVSSLLSKFK
ncbi:MAG: orotate phosphoribosyltransferase [Minisyncoccia bacterium]